MTRLRQVAPFDLLPADAFDDRSPGIAVVDLDEGATLVTAGERAEELYVLLDGEVIALGADGGADAPVLATLTAGDVVGEIAVLTGGRRSATLVAASPVTAIAIDGPTFIAVLDRVPELARRLAITASSRLRATLLAEQLQRLFPGPDAASLGAVARHAEFISLPAGGVLFSEGDEADAAYVVVTGRMRVLATDEDGGWAEPCPEVGAGELVGEMALLETAPRSATVVAARDSQLARLPRTDFEALALARPEGMLAVTRTLVERIRDTRDPYRRARSDHAAVGLVSISPSVDLDRFAQRLEARLDEVTSVTRVTDRRIEDELGVVGSSQALPGDPHELAVSRWLDDHEVEQRLMMLQGEPSPADVEPSAWTRRCVDRVDHLVLVADASDEPDLAAIERTLLSDRPFPHQRISLVLLQPSGIDHPRDTAAWLTPRHVDDHFHVRDASPDDLDRLARHLAGQAVWLVLGGGGAKGFAHIGVIHAMAELGIPIDGVAGSSVGSIMAALVAIETPNDELPERTAGLFSGVLDYTIPISGLITGKRITAAARRAIGDRDIEDTWIPFLCVSTNITRSRVMVHRRGDFVRTIRASTAIPGVMPPVAWGEDLLVDGGVMNNLPVDIARRLNPTGTVVASDVAPKLGPRARGDHGLSVSGGRVLARRLVPGMRAPKVPRLAATLMRSLLAAAAETRDRQVAAGLADLHLAFELRGVGLLAFDVVEPVVQRGYEESIEQLTAFAAERFARDPEEKARP